MINNQKPAVSSLSVKNKTLKIKALMAIKIIEFQKCCKKKKICVLRWIKKPLDGIWNKKICQKTKN